MTLQSSRHVEGRLVARAEQVVGLLLVQADRAADVGADLGVGDDAVVGPVLASWLRVEVVRVEPDEQDGGLGLLVERVVRRLLVEALGHDVEDRADGDVRGLDRASARGRAIRRMPFFQIVVRAARCRAAGRGRRPAQDERAAAKQRRARRPGCTGSAGGGRCRRSAPPSASVGDRAVAVLVAAAHGVPVLDDLLVGHERLGPVDRRRRRCRTGDAQGQRRADEVLQRRSCRCPGRRSSSSWLDREVGDDEPTACRASRGTNSVATWRSARLARRVGSVSRHPVVRARAGRGSRTASAAAVGVAGVRRGSSCAARGRARRVRGRSSSCRSVSACVGRRSSCARAHADFDPSQTAQPIRPPRPTIQTNRPSGTGPRLPSVEPARVRLVLRWS